MDLRREPDALFLEYGDVVLRNADVALLHGNHWLNDEGAGFLESMQAQDKETVIFAVNDNDDARAAGGGTHWTMLLYSRTANCFRHYDSAPGSSSRSAATRLYKAVRGSLAPQGTPCPLVHVEGMPRQQNGYDCGVYLLTAADQALALAMQSSGGALDLGTFEEELKQAQTVPSISTFRDDLRKLVHDQRQKQLAK